MERLGLVMLTGALLGAAFSCFLPLARGGDVRVRRDDDEIKVTTIKEPPYLMSKPSGTGNDAFEGLIPDLMKEIASRAQFEYKIHLVKDGRYGMLTGGNNWNGMIGEVLRKEADLAAAPITISEARKKVVQFTEPFMNITTTILIKKPKAGEKPPFKTPEELADQSDVKYGLIKDGTTQKFFQSSTVQPYKKMWDYMSANPDLIQTKMADGVNKVRNSDEKYAFIVESSTADYWVSKYPCELMRVGDFWNRNGYGLATASNPDLHTKVNNAIKALKSNGQLQKLKDKWWKADSTCDSGSGASSPGATTYFTALALLSYFVFSRLA